MQNICLKDRVFNRIYFLAKNEKSSSNHIFSSQSIMITGFFNENFVFAKEAR